MSGLTAITLPQSIPFPVTIISILCRTGETIPKHKTLFKYKYWCYQDDPNSDGATPKKIRVERIGSFESPIEGKVEAINIKLNSEVAHSGVEICHIREPCSHAVQYGGLCALCGKSLEDEKDYSGYNYEDRATISMTHDNADLKISLDEAEKIETNTTDRLVDEKKLILVVDLDQTVIHATVDPTVGEWQLDPSNPNYKAVKDVKSFCLEEESIAPLGWEGPKLPATKCWYYVKVRPGLEEFLEQISKLYEMHIYTMATRNYALEIAKIIDPDGKYFGDRILSRDESGSLTHKNLKRLFPVDQSMVAIIDDRGDVWQWENNLIKVVPYDFFVGIGDINSSFLPKKNGQLTGPIKKRRSIARLEALEQQEQQPEREQKEQTSEGENRPESKQEQPYDEQSKKEDDEENDAPGTQDTTSGSSPVDKMVKMGGGERSDLIVEQSINRTMFLEQQQHDRPLAKLQHDLEKIHQQHDSSLHSNTQNTENGENEQINEDVDVNEGGDDDDDDDENLLHDDDAELYMLEKALERIHNAYYTDLKEARNGERPDLTEIIPNLKRKCLEGITILFSGILPLGTNYNNADIVIWCKQFGVRVVNEVVPEVTHIVARDPSTSNYRTGFTFKVRVARKVLPSAKLVNPDWLFMCLSSWKKVDEEDYLIHGSEEDWHVEEKDVKRYLESLESRRAAERRSVQLQADANTQDDAYALFDAYQEVDEFLASDSDSDNGADGVSDGEDDDQGMDPGASDMLGDEADDEDSSDRNHASASSINSTHDSFIKDAYTSTKRSFDQAFDYAPKSPKRSKPSSTDSDDSDPNIEELEKELLDGFDDLQEGDS